MMGCWGRKVWRKGCAACVQRLLRARARYSKRVHALARRHHCAATPPQPLPYRALQVLYASNNKIDKWAEVERLQALPKLRELNLVCTWGVERRRL